MIHINEKICPRCDAPTMRRWNDLTEEDRSMAGRLGVIKHNTTITKHDGLRVCIRCWHTQKARDDGDLA